MERNAQEELKAHLMVTNEEFRRLAGQHSEFAQKLDALESLPHLTYEEELEETRLKKLKLRLKDQMEAIVSLYRSQQVALASGARSSGDSIRPGRLRLTGPLVFMEPIRIPITDVFDLHSIPPRDVKAVVEEYLHEAHRLGFHALRIIHGRGIGVQREMVRSVLARADFVADFPRRPRRSRRLGRHHRHPAVGIAPVTLCVCGAHIVLSDEQIPLEENPGHPALLWNWHLEGRPGGHARGPTPARRHPVPAIQSEHRLLTRAAPIRAATARRYEEIARKRAMAS